MLWAGGTHLVPCKSIGAAYFGKDKVCLQYTMLRLSYSTIIIVQGKNGPDNVFKWNELGPDAA